MAGGQSFWTNGASNVTTLAFYHSGNCFHLILKHISRPVSDSPEILTTLKLELLDHLHATLYIIISDRVFSFFFFCVLGELETLFLFIS